MAKRESSERDDSMSMIIKKQKTDDQAIVPQAHLDSTKMQLIQVHNFVS